MAAQEKTVCVSARPTAAMGPFPYPHATLDKASTPDPARWRDANRAYFDAIYGPDDGQPALFFSRTVLAERLAQARQWRIDTRPYFDALYGDEGGEP